MKLEWLVETAELVTRACRYRVEAGSKEEAEEKFDSGVKTLLNCEDIDIHDREVLSIEQLQPTPER